MSEQLARSLQIFRRHWRILVLVPLVALVVSLVISSRQTPAYTATAKVVISPYNPVMTLLSPGSNPTSADPERDLNTEVSEITETPVADLVRSDLRLNESSQDLLNQVSANLEGTTNIVDVAVTDGDPGRAAQIANAFAEQYEKFRLTALRNTLEQAAASDQQKLAALAPAQQASAAGTQLQNDINTLQADSDGLTSDAQVSQLATVPTSPTKPKPLIDALIALIVGLLVAIVAAIVLELLDRTVRDEEDAAAVAGVPSLGVIPKPATSLNARAARPNLSARHLREALALPSGLGLNSRRTVAYPNRSGSNGSAVHGAESNGSPARFGELRTSDWEVDESYGSLAVSLLSQRLGPDQNVVLVTSPGPRDGKTSVALGLAGALAELGQKVVLVEGDMRRPRFADYLGLPAGGAGLSSILAGVASAPAGLVEVAAPRHAAPVGPRTGAAARSARATATRAGRSFTALPCGTIPSTPLALLRGEELGALLHELRSSADMVIIDTPPLGPIKDAVVLAESVDQIMLVARIGHTRRDALGRCRAAVDQLGSPVLGIVTVGGPRGGAIDYYFRPELEVSVAPLSKPEPVDARQRQAQTHSEPQEQVTATVAPATDAAAKGGRSRRRAGADHST